jgi:cytochrome P450
MPSSARSTAPGPRGSWPIGSFFDEAKDPLGFLCENQRRFGDVFLYRMGGRLHCVLSHPEDVKRVLIDEAPSFPKPAMPPSLFAGKGLFGSEGEPWRKHRRMIQPAFLRERMLGWVDTIVDATGKMLARWEPFARSGQGFDGYEEMLRLAYTVQARLSLTEEPPASIYENMRAAVRHIGLRDSPMRELVYGALPFLSPWRRQMEGFMRPIDVFIFAKIAMRRRGEGVRPDLLQMLLELRDKDTGEGFSDTEVRDELMNLWGAGYEATGAALAWALFLLDRNPHVLERLRRETQEVLAGGPPTVETVDSLVYAGWTFREALRVFPPAWRLERQATRAVEFRGVRVPAGTLLFMLPYMLHRDPRFWESPEVFEPERFAPERSAGRPRCSYVPFGAGQRTCLGNTLALMKGALILAMVVQRYRVHPVSPEVPPFSVGVTLTPKDGLPVRLSPS